MGEVRSEGKRALVKGKAFKRKRWKRQKENAERDEDRYKVY